MTQQRYYRKIIKITAEDSPNVKAGLLYASAGKPVSPILVIPGVLPYDEYLKRRATWDSVRQCIGLDAEFYEGAEVLLYPPLWLNFAEAKADELVRANTHRIAKAMGVDPAEGGDRTAFAIVDELGLIDLISVQTPDTTVVTSRTIALIERYNLAPERVFFDRGGGGKEHADRLRAQGYKVQSVGFGEASTIEPRRGMIRVEERKEVREERYTYKNRRAEMYGELRILLDPSRENGVFAIPKRFVELRRQLSLFPLWWDEEGRLYLPPKQRKTGDRNTTAGQQKQTLDQIIGHSPDESDALVLAVHAMQTKMHRQTAEAF